MRTAGSTTPRRYSALLAGLLALSALSLAAAQHDNPNVVFIFIDDMGYGDIGPFGNTINNTPELDRMAEEGLVLKQFYVSNTACTPSRSALMTGTYASRIGMDGRVVFPGEKRGLNPDEITIAELMKASGYATGCFGKWHLGDQPEFLPPKQGFDEYFGIPYSNDMWPGNKRGNPVTDRGPYTPLPVVRQDKAVAYVSDGADQALLCEVITDEAVKFIRKHKDHPFFLYVPHAYVHNPRFARRSILEKAGGNPSRANVEEVDTSVGRILNTLRDLKLDKDTLVIFTSDNGGAGGMSMGPLRGGKGGPKYEGHMREPTITWWPGTIPAGAVTHEIAATVDILPSLAKLVGAKIPDDRIIDGKDALDVLLGKPGAKSPHEILYYEDSGIRRGKWKLVKKGRGKKAKHELYDLDTDIGETKNLAGQHPDILKELTELLEEHAAEINTVVRPPGMVETAKPIISEPGGLPRLREYMGMPNIEAFSGLPRTQDQTKKPTLNPDEKFGAARTPYEPAPDHIIITDFENKDYGDWKTEGKAFGAAPARANVNPPRNRVTGHAGKRLVNSYLGGDKTTGKLVSPTFTIQRRHINFLIGGGNHPGATCINLVVNGKTVRTATGTSAKDALNREIIIWKNWNVKDLKGQKAHLEIIDNHSRGWGHINVDQIFQSDTTMTE